MIELHVLALVAAVFAGAFIGFAVGTVFGERISEKGFTRRLANLTREHRIAVNRTAAHNFNLGVKSVLGQEEANNEDE